MKLLLTSGGFTNDVLIASLIKLAGKPLSELKIAFIPTAANVENEDKRWLFEDMARINNLNPVWLDLVDIAAMEPQVAIRRLEQVDVLIFGGGDSHYLMEAIAKADLLKVLTQFLESKVYVGISAGSVITGRIINPKMVKGLGWVEFLVVPHMNAPFTSRTASDIEDIAKLIEEKVYWIDDNMAIEVDGEQIRVVGKGESQEFG